MLDHEESLVESELKASQFLCEDIVYALFDKVVEVMQEAQNMTYISDIFVFL